MTLRSAILVRPFTWTYLTSPSYSFGKNLVNASVVSYMWLSASKTGKSTTPFDMATSTAAITAGPGDARRRFSTSTSILYPGPDPATTRRPGVRGRGIGPEHRREEEAPMATYVLVHGGGHGGWCYQRVARLLRAEGHEVLTPTLTGLGERAHLLDEHVDLERHVTDVAAVLRFEDLRDVILVGHSYGGMVITGAADREADRVGRLVYLDAATPTNGQSLVDVAGPVINAVRPMGEVVDGIELVLLPGPDAGLLYGVTDPSDLTWMAERLSG